MSLFEMGAGPQRRLAPAFQAACLFWASAAALTLWIGLAQVGKPFLGFLLSPSGHVGATDLADWGGPRAGLKPLDRVVSIEGVPLAPGRDAREAIRGLSPGTPVRYGLEDGRTVVVPVAIYRWHDFVRFEWLWWLAAVVHLGLGAWVVARRPGHPAAEAHWRYCQIFATFLLAALASLAWPPLEVLHFMGTVLMLAAIAELVLAFPTQPASPAVVRTLRRAAWMVALGLCLGEAAAQRLPAYFPLAFRVALAVPSLALVAALVVWGWEAFSGRFAAGVRAQARIALVGLGLSLAPSLVYGFAAMAQVHLPGFELAFLGFCAFPAAIATAIVRHQAFDLGAWARRAALYSLLTLSLGALYVAAAMLGHQALGWASPSLQGASLGGFAAALAVAIALRPLHAWLTRWVDALFLGRRADPMRVAAEFGTHAATAEATALAQDMAELIRQLLGAAWVELFADGERVATDGTRREGEAAALAASVPGARGRRLEVGPREDELAYSARERELLEVLASQVALGLERVAHFEERLRLEVHHAEVAARAEGREALLRQVVHDLSTDLSNIAVATDMARQVPREGRYLDSIEASLQRIERFLSEKRARLHAGEQARGSSLREGVRLTLAALAPRLAERRQRVVWDGAGADVRVPLSEVELGQVLGNVLDNAIKFSPVDSEIRLTIEQGADEVRVKVEDAGPGVSAELLGSPSSGRRGDRAVPGDGLGLLNVLALLEPVGARLGWANGEAGAIVEIALPVRP